VLHKWLCGARARYDQVSIDDCWERRGPGGPRGNETWRTDPDSGRVNGSLAGLDEGISSFYPPILVYMENPYRDTK
jgi:hypothetical protein